MSYLFAAEIGHLLSFEGHFASLLPPSGVYLSALLLTGQRRWPVFLAAALIANIASDVGLHDKPLPVSIGFWIANTAEAASTALLLRVAVGQAFPISTLKNVLWLLGSSALCGNVLGASLGASIVTAVYGADFWSSWLVWWIGGLIGSLLVTPGVLNFATLKPWKGPAFVWRAVESLAVVLTTSSTSYFVFGCQARALSFTTLPLLIWAAARLQVCGAVLSACALSVTCVWNTAHGYGPFAFGQSITQRVLLTQCFLVVSTLVPLLLGALMMETKTLFLALETHRRRLELIASTDGLTGISNRSAFQTRLKGELDRVAGAASPVSLILIDVDHFKSFNDTFGHTAGDDVLRSVGMILRESVRGGDFVARFGGEEFAVLLPGAEEAQAIALAERIRKFVEQAEWKQLRVTISLGVTTTWIRSVDSLDVINAADKALYASKRSGRNRLSFASTVQSSVQCSRALSEAGDHPDRNYSHVNSGFRLRV